MCSDWADLLLLPYILYYWFLYHMKVELTEKR
jgi:hypothetical protein